LKVVNHPNRGWRSRWTVDLEAATATHRDGWVFQFAPDSDEADAFDGDCIGRPDPIMPEHLREAARIAREAGDIFIEARRGRH
jgi:hypothetical protein